MSKTKLQQYSEIQEMVRKESRDIAMQVYEEMASKYDVVNVPFHNHNNINSPILPATSVEGFVPLPANTGGVLSSGLLQQRQAYFYQKNEGLQSVVSSIPIYPLPIISGDITPENFQFAGGDAPDGTLLIYKEAAAWQLWIRLFGVWKGVNLTLSVSPLTVILSAPLAGGETSADLDEPWVVQSGSYVVTFSDSSVRVVTFVFNNTAISWSGAIGPNNDVITVQIS